MAASGWTIGEDAKFVIVNCINGWRIPDTGVVDVFITAVTCSHARLCRVCRFMSVECGLLPQANGSARVSCVGGATEVLAAVKCELADPPQDAPDQGRLEVSVECYGSSSLLASQRAVDVNSELSAAVQSAIAAPGAIDLRKLGILKGKHSWNVFVDIVVFDTGGSLVDACTLAAAAALQDTKIPKIKLVKGESEGEFDIELDDDPSAHIRFPANDVPIGLTFVQIGRDFVVDADNDEEACSQSKTTVAINRRGNICALSTNGGSGIAPQALHSAVEASKRIASALFERIDRALSTSGAGAGLPSSSSAAAAPSPSHSVAMSSWLQSSDAGATLIDASNVVNVQLSGSLSGMSVR